ncbi:MAG: LysR family transcriptional regulator [Porticoccaceae bacterium]|nr:LysR family transcriptional regulator [Porticoccaceae bacterium]
MSIDSLSRVDLNLLVAMHVLLEERNVTRSAQRLFVTQPAMSKTLSRLRILFDDPLFTRSGRGLVPTPRALEIAQALPDVLNDVSTVLQNLDFQPKTYEGAIQIVGPEFMAVQAVPELTNILRTEAPGLTLALSNISDSSIQELESGDIDFILEVEKTLPEGFVATPLGDFTPAVWMRRGHPLAKKNPTLEEILEYPFVQYFLLIADKVSPLTESRFDKTLTSMGLGTRKKALVTDQLMTALSTLHSTDCLMLATTDDLEQERAFYDIVRRPYPEGIDHDPIIPAVLVQHKRTINSPVHNWIKGKMLDIVKGIRQERGQ